MGGLRTLGRRLLDGVDDALSASPIALPINALANLLALGTTALDAALGGGVLEDAVHFFWLVGATAALFAIRSTWCDLRGRNDRTRAMGGAEW